MELEDGQTTQVRGSGSSIYEIRNTGGSYSCSCPAWRNQSFPAHQRTCKHIKALRGEQLENQRIQSTGATPPPSKAPTESKEAPLLLAHSWDQIADLSGWWMSEKLDGVRAYWDGKQMFSRLGNPFTVPEWFVADLPSQPLDGELWIGRKMFQKTVSIVRRQDASPEWKSIQYRVFDAPAVKAPFEERLKQIQEWLANQAAHCSLLEHSPCNSIDHLRQHLAHIEAQGGEGLMLRQPGSLYEIGRSNTLLKVKSFKDDEAIVIDHQPGEGRHKGRLGALLVQLPNGTRFSVGTGLSDAERDDPPPIGSQITFRYQELTDGGVPRFPTYLRLHQKAPRMSAPAKPAAPKSEAPLPQSGFTRLEFNDGSSNKFWEIALHDLTQTVRYGRIGSAGQSKTKAFSDLAQAQKDTQKLIAEKLQKGYQQS
jgi:DNA ligase 1